MFRIVPADTPQMLETVKALLVEYGGWLQANGSIYPGELRAFRDQLAFLPGCFALPDGCLLVAMYGERAAGCVALRKLSDEICEMKRLYVKPAFRHMGAGRALAEGVIAEAKKIGYTRMRVHTLRSMVEACRLYAFLRFEEISPYEQTPIEDAAFMELRLESSSAVGANGASV